MRDKSIIQKDMSKCYVCGKPKEAIHEVLYGANRQKSIRYGAYVALCNYHHNMSNHGVHFDKVLDLNLKMECQKALEKEHSREWFIKTFGKSYI